MTTDPRPDPKQYAKDQARRENADNKAKQKYEEKAVKNSDVVGEIEPTQKLVSDSPDPTSPAWENDPAKNPNAPGGVNNS